MARTFQYSRDRKIINRLILWMLKLGIAPRSYYLLTVSGRKSGQPHSIPIVIVEDGGKRWLVAPYGVVDWVKNVRASGVVQLTRKKRREELAVRELSPEEAAPFLKQYREENPITKPYFDAQDDSSVDEFIVDAKSRPVFELVNIESST